MLLYRLFTLFYVVYYLFMYCIVVDLFVYVICIIFYIFFYFNFYLTFYFIYLFKRKFETKTFSIKKQWTKANIDKQWFVVRNARSIYYYFFPLFKKHNTFNCLFNIFCAQFSLFVVVVVIVVVLFKVLNWL